MNSNNEKDTKSLILIPVFNEKGRLKNTIKNCFEYFQNILIIDDGSSDNSIKDALDSEAKYILRHQFNCGQGMSISTGIEFFLKHTRFDFLITFDADGQHQAIDAINMLDFAVSNNFDVVIGSRFLKKESIEEIPLRRRILLNTAIYFERFFYKIQLTDSNNGLRVLSRKACKELTNLNSSQMAHATEIAHVLSKSSLLIKEYPVSISYKNKKKTGQNLFSSLNIISDLIQKK